MLRIVSALLPLFLFWGTAQSQDVLDAVSFLHDPKDPIRVGIEVEFKGLTVQESMQIIQRALGGSVEYSHLPWDMIIEEKDGTRREVVFDLNPGKLRYNSTGENILVKPEYNDTSGVVQVEDFERNIVIELLTESKPIRFPGVRELQKALDALKAEGAIGTRSDIPVSLQVNVEIADGDKKNIQARHIVNLLRNYMRREHHEQIRERLQIPVIRHTYIQPLSNGFMERLLDSNYNPTLEELKDDAIYRQLKEFLGDKERAWTAPIEEIRAEILKYIEEEKAFDSKDSPLFRVIKFSPLKIASLLLYAFPNDPMADLVVKNQWIKLIPAIEFRERNNDFDVVSAVKQAVGMVRASEMFGAFIYDPKNNPHQAKVLNQFSDQEIARIAHNSNLSEMDVRKMIFEAAVAGTPLNSEIFARRAPWTPNPLRKTKPLGSTLQCHRLFAM